MKTTLTFKQGNNSGETFETPAIYALKTFESEGKIPRCLINLPSAAFDRIKDLDICEVKHNEKLIFTGNVTSLLLDGEILRVGLQTLVTGGSSHEASEHSEPPESGYPHQEILEKFRQENPDIAVPIVFDQCSRTGEQRRVSLIVPASNPIDVNDNIIFDSLTIDHKKTSISEISVEIIASWIARFEGDIDLAARIANRFRAGKINTLTPKKLMHSWPGFGDRISHHQNAKSTKYYVSHSKLEEDESMGTMTPPLKIADDIPEIRLRRGFFDSKLTISWGFDQFMTEVLRARIKIGENSEASRTERLKINLHNVQEFVENIEMRSFFSSETGRLILENIFEGIGNYIALSMRNVEISFTIPFTEETMNLGCDTWIRVNDYTAKITKLEFELTPQKSIIKVTAMAFEKSQDIYSSSKRIGGMSIEAQAQGCTGLTDHMAAQAEHRGDEPANFLGVSMPLLKPPPIPIQENSEFLASDILHDIVIQNEAEVQFTKLRAHIDELIRSNKINKDNYRSLINTFLGENQTKIMIVVKPLKTKHCEKRVKEISEPIQFF